MKADVFIQEAYPLHVIARETGDETPDISLDLPPALINRWQLLKVELAKVEEEIRAQAEKAGIDLTTPW